MSLKQTLKNRIIQLNNRSKPLIINELTNFKIKQKVKKMKKATILEILKEPYFWENKGNSGLKYLIVMNILGKNQLTTGHLINDLNTYKPIIINGLKNFNYDDFRNENSMQIVFDKELVTNVVNELLKELTKSNVIRDLD